MFSSLTSTVSSASQLSAAIEGIDNELKADGGNGTHYVITLAAGATLTESADISAIDLTGKDTLTIGGQAATFDRAGKYRGLFVYSGATTIENLTVENAIAQGGAAYLGGGGAGLGGGLFVAHNSAGGAAQGEVTLHNVVFHGNSATGGRGGGGMGGAGAQGAPAGYVGSGGGGIGSSGVGGVGGSPPTPGEARLIPGARGGDGRLRRAAGGPSGGGGGGGSIIVNAKTGGATSRGGSGGFGGGLGAGGDIFVMAGASLTIEGGSLSGGSVTAGAGENGGANGRALGSGIFLQGTETITFAPATGTTERVFDVIADQTGSDGTGANAGAGDLTLDGAGALDLIAANTYTGGRRSIRASWSSPTRRPPAAGELISPRPAAKSNTPPGRTSPTGSAASAARIRSTSRRSPLLRATMRSTIPE